MPHNWLARCFVIVDIDLNHAGTLPQAVFQRFRFGGSDQLIGTPHVCITTPCGRETTTTIRWHLFAASPLCSNRQHGLQWSANYTAMGTRLHLHELCDELIK